MRQNQRKLSPTTCDRSKLKVITESVYYQGEKHHCNIKLSEYFVLRIQRRDESK
mgnify:CR=1 FL=1